MRRFWIFVVIVGAVFVAVSTFHYLSRPDRGDVPPPFELETLDGNSLSLDSLKGKPVLIHFWATWCDACVAEIPSLNRMYEEYKDSGLNVLGISEDENINVLRSFTKQVPLSFPVLVDPNGQVSNLYKGYGVPVTLAVGRDGLIVWRFDGPIDWNSPEAREKIKALIH